MTRSAWAEMDLGALRHNFARVKQTVGDSRIMAVIKADGYGHGLIRVARTLSQADAFAVASIDEAIRLRDAAIKHPVVVLAGFLNKAELQICADRHLNPVVHQKEQVALLEQANVSLDIWVKLDTGMHRLGFSVEEFDSMLPRLEACSCVASLGFLTHLANADDLSDATPQRQINSLRDALVGRSDAVLSIANSGGNLGWQESHHDWVRPGIMLYGASPFADGVGADLNLKPVMSFKARLIAIKNLKAGDKVGYSGTYTAPQDMMMGVIGAGYGDGYPRHIASGSVVKIRGQDAAIIGRVSMDLMCVDLSNVPAAQLEDEVLLWGPDLPVELVARQAGTIAYELTCQITQRVRVKEI